MRLCIASLLLSATLSTAAVAQANSSTMAVMPQAQLDVVKVLLAQERAWNDGKIDEFLSGYAKSPQTTFIGESVQHGSDTLAQRYHNTYPNRDTMGTLAFSDLDPRLLDDRFAVITGRYHLERSRKGGGNADGVFSLVLEKMADGWKIILDHTS